MDKPYSHPWLPGRITPLDWNGPARPSLRAVRRREAGAADHRAVRRTGGRPSRSASPSTTASTSTAMAQALARVRALAARIAAATRPGDLVAGLLPASADFSIAMLACLARGPALRAARSALSQGLARQRAGRARRVAAGDRRVSAARRDALVPDGAARIDMSARWRPPIPASPSPRSGPMRRRSSSSPPAAPASPRASSTASARCCAASSSMPMPAISGRTTASCRSVPAAPSPASASG